VSLSPKRSSTLKHPQSYYRRLDMTKGRPRGAVVRTGGSSPKAAAVVRGAASAAAAAPLASDAEELGYLLSCVRANPPRRGGASSQRNHDNQQQQLKALLDSAVRQAFPPSSSSSSSTSLPISTALSALKARWLSATALLLNSPKTKLWLSRDPAHLARAVHRAFHSRGNHDDDNCRGAATLRLPRGRPALTGRIIKAAPMGTLESTVLGSGSGMLSPSSSFEEEDDVYAHQVSGTDTATSSSSSSSSSDEDDERSLGLISAQELALLRGRGTASESMMLLPLLQQRLYRRFVEALHLELVGQSPSVLGGRVFHVYPLTGRVRSLLQLHDVRKQIENEFHVLQSGGGGAGGRHRPVATRRMGQNVRAASECRVYACRPPKSTTTLWIQVSIGSPPPPGPGSASQRKSKASSASRRSSIVGASMRHPAPAAAAIPSATGPCSTAVMYHILLQEGGMHVAMASSGPPQRQSSSSASNAKEQAATAQWILAALDSAVTAVAASLPSSATRTTKTRKKKMHGTDRSRRAPSFAVARPPTHPCRCFVLSFQCTGGSKRCPDRIRWTCCDRQPP
jgi:hypothetical protein